MAVAGDAQSRFGSADTRDQGHETGDADRGVPAVPDPRRSRLVRRRRHQHAATGGTGDGHDSQSRSRDPAVRRIDDRDGEARQRRVGRGAVRRDGARRRQRARPDDRAPRVEYRRVRNGDRRSARRRGSRPPRRSATPTTSSTERLAIPAGVLPSAGGLNIELASSALVGLGEGARYLADYPYYCAEQKASAALALAARGRSRRRVQHGTDRAGGLPQARDGAAGGAAALSVQRRRVRLLAGGCLFGEVYLTSYVLHVMHVADTLGMASNAEVIAEALDFLERELKQPPPRQVQWLPPGRRRSAYGAKVLDRARAQSGFEHHAPGRDGRSVADLRASTISPMRWRHRRRGIRATTTSFGG